jgi:hypothetical protein
VDFDKTQSKGDRVLETAKGADLLRVMSSKLLNFIFSVTVRPREALSSQCRQTLSSVAAVRRRAPRGDTGVWKAA